MALIAVVSRKLGTDDIALGMGSYTYTDVNGVQHTIPELNAGRLPLDSTSMVTDAIGWHPVILDLAAMVAGVGAAQETLYFYPGSYTISADLTIPANIILWIPKGGLIIVPNGVTLTIESPFDAGLFQVFSCVGTGQVIFATGVCREYHPVWFGAVCDGVADDVTPLSKCWASITSGNLRLPPTIKTSGSLTVKEYCGVVGSWDDVNYSGDDYWLKVPTLTPTHAVTLEGWTCTCTGVGNKGVLQHQDPLQVIDAAKFSQWWTIRNIKGVGNNVAGSVGLSLTQLADSIIDGVIDFSEFETAILANVTTRNKYYNPKLQTSSTLSNSTGFEWRGGYNIQEEMYSPTFILTRDGCVGLKVDSGFVSVYNPFYETENTGFKAKAFLWLTGNATGFQQSGARYGAVPGTIDNLILTDDASTLYQRGVFIGEVVAGSGAGLSLSIGTTGSPGAWQFVCPGVSMGSLLHAAVVAGTAQIIGGLSAPSTIKTPGACVNLSAAVSIPNATPTVVLFDGSVWDNDAMTNISVDPTKIICVTSGVYAINFSAGFADNSTGIRYIRIALNGVSVPGGNTIPAASVSGTYISTSSIYNLAAGDYIQGEVYQSSTVALNLNSARLTVQRISSAD